jgi:beta-lactamase regulating signal transducer with metallopeptidase domain/uncharacterized protein involved in exopolysaccharide biosynthesis
MNHFDPFVGLLSKIGWVLLHSVWQGALIGIVWGLIRFLMRRSSARARYLVACTGLALLPLLPVLTVLNQPLTLPRLGPAAAADTAGSWFPAASLDDVSLGQEPSRVTELCARVAPCLTPVWLLGVLFCAARLFRNCWWLRTVRFQSYEPEGTELIKLLNALRKRLRIDRPVRLLQSALVDVPTVIGWLRPVILLPFSSLVGLAPGQIEAILVHELAHIRRFDHLVNLFQCLVETLMFYHPVLWWLTNWVRDERENCCDDVVLSVCSDRLAYARALATLEEYRSPLSPLALAATDGSLLGRIRRLLGVPVEPSLSATRKFCGMGLFLVGLLFILLGTSLAFARPSFQATARIKLGWEQQPVAGDREDKNGQGDLHFRYALQTQQALIGSQAVLVRVIGNLNLKNAWTEKFRSGPPTLDQLVALLRRRLTVRPVRQTTLVEINAADERPERAAAIANGVVDAFRSFLLDNSKASAAKGLQGLTDQFDQMEEKVRKKQAEVEQVRKNLNLPNTFGEDDRPSPRLSAETLRNLEAMRIEVKGQITSQQMLLERLQSLPRRELVEVLPTASPDALLQSLLEQQSLIEQRLLAARKDFGPEHAEVVKANLMAEGMNEKIKRRVDGILGGLTERVRAQQGRLESLEQEVVRASDEDRRTADLYSRYSQTRNELEEMKRFRQILYLKLASEKLDAALPQTASVQLVDAAEVPNHPGSYHRSGAIGLILLGLVLDGISLALLRGRPRLEAVAI